jgi:putative addiction module component (TIGR02574 family)
VKPKQEMEAKMATVLEQAIHLTVQEKLDLISALWESMAEHLESIPVPDWQLKELDQRIETQRRNPQPGETWDDVKREIRHGKK